MHFEVMHDQLFRIGKFDNLTVLPIRLAEHETGVGYRTRSRFAVNDAGNLAMRKFHSNELIEIENCLIASSELNAVTKSGWAPGHDVTIVQGSDEVLVITDRKYVPEIVYQNQYGSWRVPAGDFWQVHRSAPAILIEEVLTRLNLDKGDRVADLYAGVGLFAQPIANRVGSSGKVVAVEFDNRAHQCASKNLAEFGWAQAVNSDVAKYLKTAAGFDKAVVDPPRSGLNSSVIKSLTNLPDLTQVCYVSCDPGTLARDLREFADFGWQIGEIQPMLLFPMTAHLEAVVSVSKLS
jgi:tRNA/tmRNA/rRNA uracil-C5-methylase (TrmA/RlmC/RlmD family)